MILSYSISARPTPTVRFFKSLGQRWAEYEEWGAGSEDYAFEAYERMTDGGVQLTPDSRSILSWIAEVRFTPYGRNRWSVCS